MSASCRVAEIKENSYQNQPKTQENHIEKINNFLLSHTNNKLINNKTNNLLEKYIFDRNKIIKKQDPDPFQNETLVN